MNSASDRPAHRSDTDLPAFDPERLRADLIRIRRQLHRCPEPAFQERRTAAILAGELARLDIPHRTGIAGTGLVAEIGGHASGPLVALRADMDGLPIEERTGLPFASEQPGMMHACGHDGHMAMCLGAAMLLRRIPLAGTVRLLFQPAEERGGGAEQMIAAGALHGVDCILGGHLDTHHACGEIVAAPGAVCAHTDEFQIELRGRGGHAARPHETSDPIAAAASLVMHIHSLTRQAAGPNQPCVVSVGQLTGGTAPNVIAARATLRGTVRALQPETRSRLLDGIRHLATATAELFALDVQTAITPGYPPVVNDARVTTLVRRVIDSHPGEYHWHPLDHPSLGGEDFSFYLQQVPGCFIRIGARPEHAPPAPAHSPAFDFNEEALLVGATLYARTVLALLSAWPLPAAPAGEVAE